ncbi:MAG: DUF1190 domain-containing protein [Hyphomicrobiales bacterium]|nr:DUF1190 domain-containing protein [Hyphomicrobiales bacterium]
MARQARSRTSSRAAASRNGEKSGGRKRTMVVSLLALGAGAVTIGSYMSSSDGQKSDNKLFTSQAQCERDSAVPKEQCGKQYVAALQAHEKNAPKFPSQASCEQEHGQGQCVHPSTSTSSVYRSYFVPVMSGYLLGRTAAGGYQSAPLYRKRTDPAGRYRQMAPFPQARGSSPGAARTSRSAFRSRTWTSSSSGSRVSSTSRSSYRSTYRGGFGRSSRGYSGG